MLINVKLLLLETVSTNLVSVVPESFVNDIESPIFNSSLNLVPKPVNTLLATVIEPLN